MALNTNAALLQLDPLAPLKLDLPDRKAASMERERLQLMREQFEETKRRNTEDDRLRAMEEAGRTTREQLQNERAAAQAKAAQDAVTLQHKRAAYDDFLKYRDTGDYEGMEAGAARLHQLGADVERLGQDENGLPSWRIELDAEKARADADAQDQQAATYGPNETAPESLDRMNALGYDTLGARDSLANTEKGAAAPLSTEEAFRQAQQATRGPDEPPPEEPEPMAPGVYSEEAMAQQEAEKDAAANYAEPDRSRPMAPPPGLEPSIFQAIGRPAKGPDAPDFQGGVPKNVLDFGAMNAQTQQRLGPVMANIEASMPQAYRSETAGNNRAAAGMGLPVDKAVEQSLKLRGPAETALKDELGHGYDVEKDARKVAADAALTPVEQQKLVKYGRDAATGAFTRNGVKDSVETMLAVKTVSALLDDEFPENDDYAINFLMKLAEQKGAQSDKDAMRMDGISAASTVEQVRAWIKKHVEGGTYEPFKNAMKAFAQRQRDQHRDNVFSFIDTEHEAADKAEHPLEGKGRNEIVESLPAWIRKEYNDSLPKDDREPDADPGAAPHASGQGGAVPDGESPIPKTARIAYEHNNPGNLMFDKDNPAGAEVGEPKEGGGNWARFPTVEAGVAALEGWVERHQDMTIRAFITKYAPPKDKNDTEKYIADAARELKADPDDTVEETDFYDMVRFIAKHESGTEMPYQHSKRDAELEKFDREHPAPAETTASAPGAGDAQLLEGVD